jgi:hypothetical protein
MFQHFAAVRYGDDLPGKTKWIMQLHFDGIKNWHLGTCLDYWHLSPTIQKKLPGSRSVSWTKLAVRERIFVLARVPYIPPGFKDAPADARHHYNVLQPQLLADTLNDAQTKAGIAEPVTVTRGNGRTMNEFIRQVQDKLETATAAPTPANALCTVCANPLN